MSVSKQKGTGGEREVRGVFSKYGFRTHRTAPGHPYDIRVEGEYGPPLHLLATRPDRGQWLVTLRLEDLVSLLAGYDAMTSMEVEVKRYARFAHHRIFEETFHA